MLPSQLKHFVGDLFGFEIPALDDIADDEPLNGGVFRLDSLDVLELAMGIEEKFGVAIRGGEQSRNVFASIASLAEFISDQSKAEHERGRPIDSTVGLLPIGPFARLFVA